jgi:hypothetical protein
MVIFSIVNRIEASSSCRHTLMFATLGSVIGWYFVFGEDRLKRAFGDARATVDAGIRVNVVPRPFFGRFPGNDALHWAYFYTARIAKAQAGDNMGHYSYLQYDI